MKDTREGRVCAVRRPKKARSATADDAAFVARALRLMYYSGCDAAHAVSYVDVSDAERAAGHRQAVRACEEATREFAGAR